MNSTYMLLGLYGKPRLTFEQTCDAIGISKATGYTWRSVGKFPVTMSRNPLTADVRDVAEYLDSIREGSKK